LYDFAMPPCFFNAVSGKLETLSLASAPVIDFLWKAPAEGQGASGLRQAVFVGALMDSLVYLGYSLNQNTRAGENVDLYCSGDPLEPAPRCWLKLAPVEGALPAETDPDVWKLCCLGAAYGKPLKLSPRLLEDAAADLGRLRGLALRLTASHGTAQANSKGLSGYKKRFRDALAEDADFPAALCSLWDGLRPGALSPASQLGLLREAEPVLGLNIIPGTGP
jgi:hypothetical protein